jgi:cytochrome P450
VGAAVVLKMTKPMLLTPEFNADPLPGYREVRRCPVARDAMPGSVVISRYKDVLAALRDPETFSSEMEAASIGQKRPLIPLQVDPPRQTRFRRILDPHFSRRRMQALEPEVRSLVNDLIDGFADAGRCEFNAAFAVPLPCTVFLKMMGLPQEDLAELLALKDGIIRPQAKSPEEGARLREETGARIYAYFERLLEERARAPRDDLMTWFLSAELDGDRLTREEILDISYLFLLGGLDTVTATLGCSVAHLARDPEARARLVRQPELWPAAVEELLRHETPVPVVVRVVARDTTFAGHELVAGQRVLLLLGSADTDGAEFEDADAVSFDRGVNRHLAFGGGPHRCLGSHLARMELRAAFEELHRRIPDYEIAPGDAPRYGGGIREVQYLPLVFAAGKRR